MEEAKEALAFCLDVPDRPEVPQAPSFNDFLVALWAIKDEWDTIRSPICGIRASFREATAFEASITQMVQGTMYCLFQDCKLQADDLDGIIAIDLSTSPFIIFDLEKAAVVEKYKPIIDAFCAVVPAFQDSMAAIESIIEKVQEMPDKCQAAVDGAPGELAALPMMEKVKATAAVGKAGQAAKNTCTALLDDMNALKAQLLDLKDLATTMAEELKDPKGYFLKLWNIGEQCRQGGKNSIQDCWEQVHGPLDAGKKGKKEEKKEGGGGCCGCCGGKKKKGADKVAADEAKAREEAPVNIAKENNV